MNYSIKLDLMKVAGASLCELLNQNNTKTKCVVIPVEGSGIFVGEKGVYLNLSATELKETRFDQTHLVKVELTKEAYQALSEEQRRMIPIIGNMRERQSQAAQTLQPTAVIAPGQMTTVMAPGQQPAPAQPAYQAPVQPQAQQPVYGQAPYQPSPAAPQMPQPQAPAYASTQPGDDLPF